jgi:hypothetical protein
MHKQNPATLRVERLKFRGDRMACGRFLFSVLCSGNQRGLAVGRLELSKKADAYHEGMDELARVQMSARREAAKLCQDKCCKDKTVTIRYERTTVSTFQNWTTIPHLSNETLDCKSGSWQ